MAEPHPRFKHERSVAGPPFGAQRATQRPRIAGAAGRGAEPLLTALAARLGPGVRLLPRQSLVIDADACSVEGAPLETLEDWRSVVHSGRLDRVEGAFALGWTDSDGCVSIARDPIGHRSLYYAYAEGTFVFASSVRALLDVGAAERRIQLRSLAAYLAYAYVPGRATLVEGVYELLPGEIVSVHKSAIERRFFWTLPSEPRHFADEESLRRTLRATLERTLRAALPAAEPVAASLSGGIDSSLIVALAQRLSPRPVKSFSITFGPEHADELPWSSLVAEHCGSEHTIFEITAPSVLAHLDDTVACLDKPNGDPLTVPNALLFRAMAEHSSVALNGEGGDPCFGGPKNVPMLLSVLYGHGDEPSDEHGPGALERNYLRAHLKCFDELPELLSEHVFELACQPPLESELSAWFQDERWHALVSKLMAINTRFKGGHHILPKVDALSAPFGILARSPLFAKAVVELAFAIPPELKLRGTDEKYLLKQAVADLLPAAILERPKSGMLVPVEAWFQGPLLRDAQARLLDGLAPTQLFRRAYLEKLVAGELGGLRPRRGVKIWLLVTLEAHLRALGLTA